LSVLLLTYQKIDVTVTNIFQSLPHIVAGETAGIDIVWRNYVTGMLCI